MQLHLKNMEIIKRNKISVNVGLDGPRAITSRVRGDYDFIMKGLKGFIKNDIPFSLTAVVLRVLWIRFYILAKWQMH